MKKLIGIITLIASFNSFSAPQATPQMLLVSCNTSSNPSSISSIDLFGVLNTDNKTISNVAAVVGLNFDVGPLKMLVQGGTGIINNENNLSFKDIIEPGTSLSADNGSVTLNYQKTTTSFSNCK